MGESKARTAENVARPACTTETTAELVNCYTAAMEDEAPFRLHAIQQY